MDKNAENTKPNKIRKIFNITLDVLLVIFCAVAFATATFLFYQRVYLEPFFVNGQSMYPTLNRDACDKNGNKFGISGTAFSGSTVDYGFMDCHYTTLQNLNRFDVVVLQKSNDSDIDLVKRIIGLPGETIKFDCETGDLFVKQGDEFVFVEQPIADEYKISSTYPTTEVVLGPDEFYVCGDNRAHSTDSRPYHPFNRSLILGKVIMIGGTCVLGYDEDSTLVPESISYTWPRSLK